MFYRLRHNLLARHFKRSVSAVFETRPVEVVSAPWTIVSMVGERDVAMYLLAMKSFYRKLGRGDIVAIVSSKMAISDIDRLTEHFPGIKIEILQDIPIKPFQAGGTWERLIYITRLAQEKYVLQMDCDTITIGSDVSEIISRVESNTSYAYSDGNRNLGSLKTAASEASLVSSNYVGLALERSFSEWPQAEDFRYCRASSAIAGFAQGSGNIEHLEYFYWNMKRSLGERSREWGTEQCASNFMVANADKVQMLPFPAYATYPGLGDESAVKIFHMLGSVRYRDGYYARKGRQVVELLC